MLLLQTTILMQHIGRMKIVCVMHHLHTGPKTALCILGEVRQIGVTTGGSPALLKHKTKEYMFSLSRFDSSGGFLYLPYLCSIS
jgi:hypothetical protein